MTDFSEWFHNILEEAEIIDDRYPVKGMHVWQPQGFKIRKYTLEILRNILDKTHEEVLFPLLIPEDELAKEAIHVKGFEEEVYWVTHGGLTELNKKLALRPTSETAMSGGHLGAVFTLCFSSCKITSRSVFLHKLITAHPEPSVVMAACENSFLNLSKLPKSFLI